MTRRLSFVVAALLVGFVLGALTLFASEKTRFSRLLNQGVSNDKHAVMVIKDDADGRCWGFVYSQPATVNSDGALTSFGPVPCGDDEARKSAK